MSSYYVQHSHKNSIVRTTPTQKQSFIQPPTPLYNNSSSTSSGGVGVGLYELPGPGSRPDSVVLQQRPPSLSSDSQASFEGFSRTPSRAAPTPRSIEGPPSMRSSFEAHAGDAPKARALPLSVPGRTIGYAYDGTMQSPGNGSKKTTIPARAVQSTPSPSSSPAYINIPSFLPGTATTPTTAPRPVGKGCRSHSNASIAMPSTTVQNCSRSSSRVADSASTHSSVVFGNNDLPFNSSSAADATTIYDADDGEHTLPVKVAVRVRPLFTPGTFEDNGVHLRGATMSCIETKSNTTLTVVPTPLASAATIGSSNGLLSPSLTNNDDMGGFMRNSIASSVSSGAVPHGHQSFQGLPRTFNFDYVFGPESQQPGIYDAAISPLLSRFIEGYNVTILAYGQTSSGKTYTMGTDTLDTSSLLFNGEMTETTGIVPRALNHLFRWAGSISFGHTEDVKSWPDTNNGPMSMGGCSTIDIRVSFIEVYNEELIDLIAQSRHHGVSPPIFIRDDIKGNVVWTGVKEVPVADAQDALSILADGSRERQTGGTLMNDKSSRSHAIYTVVLNQTRMRSCNGSDEGSQEPVKIVSKLHFVDLAGSERLKKTLAVGERQREGISINSGLLALGNVISALGDTQKGPTLHVPYRDSKLTHMLRDSLGGNAQTLLIACVSAAESNLAETVNTLKYAARARNIKNRGGVNMVTSGRVSQKEVEALRATIKRLNSEVRSLQQKLLSSETNIRDNIALGLTNGIQTNSSGMLRAPMSPPQQSNEIPTRIPNMSAVLQRRSHATEELAVIKSRNQALESELEQLNDTYTELLLKFNEACKEIEERQSESFERDQRLRDREQEIRRLTSHSRHERLPTTTSITGTDADNNRPESVADTLRQRRNSARLSMSRSMAEIEKLVRMSEGTQLLSDEPMPPLPDFVSLGEFNGNDSKPNSTRENDNSNSVINNNSNDTNSAVGPGAEEFDAILEEYDSTVRSLEADLNATKDTIEALKVQLSMQETKATFAEKLNASQQSQIDTLRVQLSKAREAGQEEEQRRRALEAELEDANFNAEMKLETVANEWRVELQEVHEEWGERWTAAQKEHNTNLERIRTELEIEKARPRLSHSPISDSEIEEVYQRNTELVSEIKRLEEALHSHESVVQRLETEKSGMSRRLLESEARAAAAEETAAKLAAKLAVHKDERILVTPNSEIEKPGIKITTALYGSAHPAGLLARHASDRIVLRSRHSLSRKSESGDSDIPSRISNDSAIVDLESMTPPERRLWNLRHRHSTTANMEAPLSPTNPPLDRFSSYPELRLSKFAHEPRHMNMAAVPYDEDKVHDMLREAAAEVDRESDFEKERRVLLEEISDLRRKSRELQENNSQIKNIMNDLLEKLRALSTENDMLEARTIEHDTMLKEMLKMKVVLWEYEQRVNNLTPSGDSSAWSSENENVCRKDSAKALDNSRLNLKGEMQILQGRLDISERELEEAHNMVNEHKMRSEELLSELEKYRHKIASLEEELVTSDMQIEELRRDKACAEEYPAQIESLEEAIKGKDHVNKCLRDDIRIYESRLDDAMKEIDLCRNEIARDEAIIKTLKGQIKETEQQLDESKNLTASEARDRDTWKSRCQDLSEEMAELLSKRRKSKMLCF